MVCRNPWCKGTFIYTELDIKENIHPTECKKCRSFNKELSGGVEWKDKEYEGSRFDGLPHREIYKIKNFK